MDDQRRGFWQAYVDELRTLMELRDWRVEVQPDSCEAVGREDASAHVKCTYGRKLATLHLCDDWDAMTPEEQRQCLCHELVHCHLTGAADTVNDGMLAIQLGEAAYGILRNAFVRHLEYGVDAIAEGWADSLPLPTGETMTEEAVEALFDLDPGDVRSPLEVAKQLVRDGADLDLLRGMLTGNHERLEVHGGTIPDIGADGWPRSLTQPDVNEGCPNCGQYVELRTRHVASASHQGRCMRFCTDCGNELYPGDANRQPESATGHRHACVAIPIGDPSYQPQPE